MKCTRSGRVLNLLDPYGITERLLGPFVTALEDDTRRVEDAEATIDDDFLDFFCEARRGRNCTGSTPLERVDQTALSHIWQADDTDGDGCLWSFDTGFLGGGVSSVVFEERDEWPGGSRRGDGASGMPTRGCARRQVSALALGRGLEWKCGK
jgi:hypothetical protein